MSLSQIKLAATCVQAYLSRYRSVLAGKNVYYVNLLLAVLSNLQGALVRTFRQDAAAVLTSARAEEKDEAPATTAAKVRE